jgi:hypothetical protein
LPVATSQRRTVLSRLPDATILPSGPNATLVIESLCPAAVHRETLPWRGPTVAPCDRRCLKPRVFRRC